jgi:hypothetical protein
MLGQPAKSDMAKSKREWITDKGNTRIIKETGELKRKVIIDIEVLILLLHSGDEFAFGPKLRSMNICC